MCSRRRLLLHGVDRCPQQEGWLFIKYNRDDEAILKKRISRLAYDIAQMLEAGESAKTFLDSDIGLEFGGEVRRKYSSKYPKGKQEVPMPSDPGLLLHYQDIVGRMQNAPTKRPNESTALGTHPPNDPFRTPHNRSSFSTSTTAGAATSYASRATSATYTSTTHINGAGNRITPNSVQTRTESVLVIEQYERRFVHMEGRISTVEKSVNKSERMLDSLLRHHGISVDTIEIDNTTATTTSLSGPMELEHSGAMEGGTKRICHNQNQTESSALDNGTQHGN